MRTLLLSLTLLLGFPTFAADSGPPAQGAEDPAADLMSNLSEAKTRLKLSDAQEQHIREMVYATSKEAIDLNARLQLAELELHHLMDQDVLDEKAILKALDAQLAAQANLQRNRIKMVIALKKELTPEQWDALEVLRAERSRGGGGRGGQGFGGQQGMGGQQGGFGGQPGAGQTGQPGYGAPQGGQGASTPPPSAGGN